MNELETVRHVDCGAPVVFERRVYGFEQRPVMWRYDCDREVKPTEVDPSGSVCLVADGE